MIKLGIVGTGGISHWHAEEFSKIKGVEIVAACDINKKVLEEFINQYDIKNKFLSVDQMLSEVELDAVINTTPDSFHKDIALKVLNHNYHIFSEKPLAENYPDALEMYNATKDKNLINMVNFSYRNFAGFQGLSKIVRSGELGAVKHVDAIYYQSWLTCKYWGDWRTNDTWLWRLSTKHGSNGVLGDLGVHIFDFATYPVGKIKRINCLLKTFKDKGERIKQYVLDANDTFLSMVEFDNGATGMITSTRFATGYKNRLELQVFCDKGGVRVRIPDGDYFEITRDIDSEHIFWKKVNGENTPNNFERFIKSIETGIYDQPDFERGAEIQKILDCCFESSNSLRWVDIN